MWHKVFEPKRNNCDSKRVKTFNKCVIITVSSWIIVISVAITIIELVHADSVLLSCQCSATESVFRPNCRQPPYYGTTIGGSWEHLLMCQRRAVCTAQKIIPRSFSKNQIENQLLYDFKLETLWSHAVSHQWESVDQRLQLWKEVVRRCHKNEKRVYAPKWKISLPWNTTKNRVTISWLLPP